MLHQLVMTPHLDDLSSRNNEDYIGIPNSGQPVCDDDRSTLLCGKELIKGFLDNKFTFRVEGACCYKTERRK
jgi:hypothetical protein